MASAQNQSGISARKFDKTLNNNRPSSQQSDLSDDSRRCRDVSREHGDINSLHSISAPHEKHSNKPEQFFQEINECSIGRFGVLIRVNKAYPILRDGINPKIIGIIIALEG